MNSRILVTPARFKGQPGFDIKVRDSKITVQELLDELNQAYQEMNLPRLWPGNRVDCAGCDLCCQEPLPVTSVDVRQLRETLGVGETEVFRYLWVELQGPAADITLRRVRGGKCVFLNTQGRCRVYAARPFACQTYLCCQTGPILEAMRGQIVNAGMDELVRSSIAGFQRIGQPFPVNRSYQGQLNQRDWPKGYFTGKTSYSEVRLARILSFDLWRKMLLLE